MFHAVRLSSSMSLWRQLAEDLGLRRPGPGSLGWPYALTLLMGVAVALGLGFITLWRTPAAWTLLVSLLLWQPVVEELLFRGLLQGMLGRRALFARHVVGISLANVLTSVAFVLVHLVNQPVAWALGVFFPSLVFGFFRDHSGSVWPAVMLHVLFNTAFFLPWISSAFI